VHCDTTNHYVQLREARINCSLYCVKTPGTQIIRACYCALLIAQLEHHVLHIASTAAQRSAEASNTCLPSSDRSCGEISTRSDTQ
jgi:hypothetical protein